MSDEPAPQVRRPALSPSRASDFKQCPLLYRFRSIDRLPEPSSTAQVRGSVVHAALEQLYALPAAERGPDTAINLVDPAWERIVAAQPELADEIEPALRAELLEEAKALLSGYYRLEDPPDSTRRAASSASKSSSRTARCCAVSSIASTWHRPASCAWSTTKPAGRHRRRGHWPNSRPCSR
jgi:hypothetical protein